MADKKVNAADFLKPRDLSTLPERRGRGASTFYPELVEAFLASGEAAMDVDVKRIGRKPETVRSALSKAIRALDNTVTVEDSPIIRPARSLSLFRHSATYFVAVSPMLRPA